MWGPIKTIRGKWLKFTMDLEGRHSTLRVVDCPILFSNVKMTVQTVMARTLSLTAAREYRSGSADFAKSLASSNAAIQVGVSP